MAALLQLLHRLQVSEKFDSAMKKPIELFCKKNNYPVSVAEQLTCSDNPSNNNLVSIMEKPMRNPSDENLEILSFYTDLCLKHAESAVFDPEHVRLSKFQVELRGHDASFKLSESLARSNIHDTLAASGWSQQSVSGGQVALRSLLWTRWKWQCLHKRHLLLLARPHTVWY